ncbi:hypothetical protein OAO01_05525 [Oligoflexia bacterium]|nr:hypothetical protein [Oligoflexia bacterium]
MDLEGKIVFSAGQSDCFDIWVMDFASKALTQLTKGEFSCDSPKWSPDGSKIAYISNEAGTSELWTMNEDGSDKLRLAYADQHLSTPTWAADGSRLLFCAQCGNMGEIGVWSIHIEGSAPPEILFSFPGTPTHPCWSADGKRVLFSAPSKNECSIWEYLIDLNQWKRLTSGGFEDFAPVYSPEEDMIAFISSRSPQSKSAVLDYGIWLMAGDGTSLRRVSHDEGEENHVSWSPDGRYLVYCAAYPDSTRERLKIVDLVHDNKNTLKFDRELIKQASSYEDYSGFHQSHSLMFSQGLESNALHDMQYGNTYIGTERYPDWKY